MKISLHREYVFRRENSISQASKWLLWVCALPWLAGISFKQPLLELRDRVTLERRVVPAAGSTTSSCIVVTQATVFNRAFTGPFIMSAFITHHQFTSASHRRAPLCTRRIHISQFACTTTMSSDSPDKGVIQLAKDAQTVYSTQKPPWCQPWTIVGTGTAVIAGSWSVCRGWAAIIALGISGAVAVWWYVFLVLYPQQELGNSQS